MDRSRDPHESLAKAIRMLGSDDFPAHLMGWLETEIKQDNCMILAYFDGRQPFSIARNAKNPAVIENFEKIYVAGAYLLDPFYDFHTNRAPTGVYRLSEIAPDQFHRNAYYLDYYAATTLLDELALVSYPAPDVSLHICLGRDATSGKRFNAKEIKTLRRISTVVLALAERQWSDLAAQGAHSNTAVIDRLMVSLKKERGIKLSLRQAEVAVLILRGHSSASIGITLGISPQTVKVFRKQLYRKCTISSQAELFHLMLPYLSG